MTEHELPTVDALATTVALTWRQVTHPKDALQHAEAVLTMDGLIGQLVRALENEWGKPPLTVAGSAEHQSALEQLEDAVLKAEAAASEVLDLERLERERVAVGLRMAAGIMGLEVGRHPASRDESKLLRNDVVLTRARRRPPPSSPSDSEDRSHKRQLLLDAAEAARRCAEFAGDSGSQRSFHLTAAERLEDAAKGVDMIGAPSDEDERAWVMFRIARAYLNIPLVSTGRQP